MKHLEEYIDNQSNPYSLTTEQLQSRSEELQAMADYLKRISVSWTTSRPEKNTSLTYDIATEIEDDFYTIRMNIAEQADYLESQAEFFASWRKILQSRID